VPQGSNQDAEMINHFSFLILLSYLTINNEVPNKEDNTHKLWSIDNELHNKKFLRVLGFQDSRAPGFKNSRVLGFRVQLFQGNGVLGLQDSVKQHFSRFN